MLPGVLSGRQTRARGATLRDPNADIPANSKCCQELEVSKVRLMWKTVLDNAAGEAQRGYSDGSSSVAGSVGE